MAAIGELAAFMWNVAGAPPNSTGWRRYASISDVNFKAKYRASCYCNAVQYEVCSDPVDAKICHCLACQKLHGAPMQWAAIFHKHDVRITEGIDHLNFYNNELNKHERILPCKVSCALCGTLIADEGRNMWLAFPSLFNSSAKPPATPGRMAKAML